MARTRCARIQMRDHLASAFILPRNPAWRGLFGEVPRRKKNPESRQAPKPMGMILGAVAGTIKVMAATA
jgi:hypothetical protein